MTPLGHLRAPGQLDILSATSAGDCVEITLAGCRRGHSAQARRIAIRARPRRCDGRDHRLDRHTADYAHLAHQSAAFSMICSTCGMW